MMMWILILAAVVILCIVCGNRSPKIDGIEGKFFPQPELHDLSDDETIKSIHKLCGERYEKTVLQFSRNGTITYYDLRFKDSDKGVIVGTYTMEVKKKSKYGYVKVPKGYWLTCKWNEVDEDSHIYAADDLKEDLFYDPKRNAIYDWPYAVGIAFTWLKQ